MVLGPLPPELLLEVISHLPQTYSSYEAHALAAPRLVFAREDALRALCTTSHRLRTCCFPTLWERFYAEPLVSQGSAIMLTSHGLNTPLRRLRRLLVAPHIWPHIRSLSVAFLRNDATDDGTITALVQVLRRLPMLLSLTFSAACDQQIPHLISAFQQKRFPSVRQLAIAHRDLRDVFHAFPNVEKLRIPWGRERSVQCLEHAGVSMQNLSWLSFLTLGEPVAAGIVQHCPRVEGIDLAYLPDGTQLLILRHLPELRHLSFPLALEDAAKAPPIISLAQATLRATQCTGKKSIRVDWLNSDLVHVVQYSDFHAA